MRIPRDAPLCWNSLMRVSWSSLQPTTFCGKRDSSRQQHKQQQQFGMCFAAGAGGGRGGVLKFAVYVEEDIINTKHLPTRRSKNVAEISGHAPIVMNAVTSNESTLTWDCHVLRPVNYVKTGGYNNGRRQLKKPWHRSAVLLYLRAGCQHAMR